MISQRISQGLVFALAVVWAGGVGGCASAPPKQVEDPDPLNLGVTATEPVEAPETTASAEQDEEPEAEQTQEAGNAAPEFAEDMSVEEAIAAVPPNAERLNIEQEIMAEPLQNPDLYAPCKLGPSSHFKLRVAVWDGRAVGIDVATTPNNAKLAGCLKDQLKQLRWPEKVPSLNTVEYAY